MSARLEEMGPPLRELRAAFEAEVEPHRRALWNYCLRLTGSAWDAEDLVQETMLRALARLAQLWQPVDPRAYLFRIATNTWIDQRRREVRAEFRELADEAESTEQISEARVEAQEALAHLVRVLTPLQRVVFLLCETLDFRAHEAASLLGTTEGAVKAALHRARRALAVAGTPPNAPPTRLLEAGEASEIVQRYVEAFNARDPDAIAALLDESAVTTIVGSAEEIGREVSRKNSLAEWAAETTEQSAAPGLLEGREVIFVLAHGIGSEPRLYSLIELEAAAGAIHGHKIYFFSPELLEHAAAALGLEASTHGHQYPGLEAA